MDVAVLSKSFGVPDWIAKGIAEGQLKIFGGVVRDKAGRIVLHLKESGMAEAAGRAAAQAAAKVVKAGSGKGRLTWILAIGVAVVATGGGLYLYFRSKSRKKNLAESLVDRIRVFQDCALQYARELQSGQLSRVTMGKMQTGSEQLQEALTDLEGTNLSVLQAHAQMENILSFSKLVADLTTELVNERGVHVVPPRLPDANNLLPYLQYISSSLDMQRQILFPEAA